MNSRTNLNRGADRVMVFIAFILVLLFRASGERNLCHTMNKRELFIVRVPNQGASNTKAQALKTPGFSEAK